MQSKCVNHPEKQASTYCGYCGKCYCLDCLRTEDEKYVCNDPSCIANRSARKLGETSAGDTKPNASVNDTSSGQRTENTGGHSVITSQKPATNRVVALLLVGAVAFLLVWFIGWKPTPKPSRENAEKVRVGMSTSDLQEILGSADYSVCGGGIIASAIPECATFITMYYGFHQQGYSLDSLGVKKIEGWAEFAVLTANGKVLELKEHESLVTILVPPSSTVAKSGDGAQSASSATDVARKMSGVLEHRR